MAKKKRRPRNRPPANRGPAQGVATAEGQRAGGASTMRRAHKEEARKAREAARKREVRVSAARRVIVISVITLVAVGTLWFLQRAANPRPISAEAVAAAQAADCTGVVQPLSNAPGGQHLSSGQSHTYPDHPATSGPHDPTPLPTYPDVYTSPVPETQAVHFLEHSGVILYYRQTGKDALKQDVVDALAQVARDQHNTLLAPYTDLPDGTSLALTAWNHIQKCPGTISASQASTVANGFVNAFACTSVGPEPKASPDC
jgi:hypothetical protein